MPLARVVGPRRWRPRRAHHALAAILVAGLQAPARAQDLAPEIDIEIPALMLDDTSTTAHEDQEGQDLTQMVLSVAKRAESVQASASIVTVVTRDAIDQRGYLDLSDLLDVIPGFEGYRPTFYQGSPEAFARGNARTTLVLWNGIPINSPQNNQRALGNYLPMGAIDRVEVVSGPGGVLWGADAFLGIVSVTTQRDTRHGSHGELVGSVLGGPRNDGGYRASATVADSWHDGRDRVYANLELITDRGPTVTPPYDLTTGPYPAPANDGTFTLRPSTGVTRNERNTWVPLTVGVDLGDFKLDVLYPIVSRQFNAFNDLGIRTDQFVGADGQLIYGPSSQRQEGVTLASARLNRALGPSTHLDVQAYYTGFEDRYIQLVKQPAGVLGPVAIYTDETYTGMNWFLHDGAYRYGLDVDVSRDTKLHKVVLGGEVFDEGLREVRRTLEGGLTASELVLTHPGNRVVTALYAQDEVDLMKSVAVEGGLRGQYAPGAYAPLLLGSAAARWSPSETLSLKLNAAQGFRPPAFELTNGNDDPITNPFFHRQANPNLRAERSLSLESEIAALVPADGVTIRNVAFRLGYQYTRLDDLIVFATNGAPTNANRRIMNSVELRTDLSLVGGHRFIFGYTYLTGVDLETGPLRNIPQHRFNLTLEAKLDKHLHAFFGMTMTGRVEDLDRLPVQNMDGTFTATPSNAVVDRLPASLKIDCGVLASGLGGGHFDVAAFLNNALDSRYSIADPDFEGRSAIYPITAPGLSAMLSVTTRM